MKRPIERDYTSQVAYARALEEYCNTLESVASEPEPVRRVQKQFMEEEVFYTAPPQRQPLSYVQINEIYRKARRLPKECDEYGELISASDIEFARAIERAHGIGGQP